MSRRLHAIAALAVALLLLAAAMPSVASHDVGVRLGGESVLAATGAVCVPVGTDFGGARSHPRMAVAVWLPPCPAASATGLMVASQSAVPSGLFVPTGIHPLRI